MVKQKSKFVYLILIVQLIAIVALLGFNIQAKAQGTFQELLYSDTIFSTILFDAIFLGIMCWQNEKMNLSQTWRQIPISNTKFYVANIMSTLLCCAYLFIVQIIINIIVTLPKITMVFTDLVGYSDDSSNFWSRGIIFGIFLILIVTNVSVFVSFTNFSTRIIVDFLPVKNTAWIKTLVMGIMVIIGVYVGMLINDHFTNFVATKFADSVMIHSNIREVGSMQITDIELAIISLILGSLNIWFINKFIETRIKN